MSGIDLKHARWSGAGPGNFYFAPPARLCNLARELRESGLQARLRSWAIPPRANPSSPRRCTLRGHAVVADDVTVVDVDGSVSSVYPGFPGLHLLPDAAK